MTEHSDLINECMPWCAYAEVDTTTTTTTGTFVAASIIRSCKFYKDISSMIYIECIFDADSKACSTLLLVRKPKAFLVPM